MTRRRAGVGLLMALFVSVALFAQSAQELYQQALVQEHAEGDLKRAIALYAQAARSAGRDRTLAAKATMRMAVAQEKLGDEVDAAATYATVVQSYPDQRAEVAQAQERLSALRLINRAPSPSSAIPRDAAATARPMLDRYCVSCHSTRVKASGLDLEALAAQPIANDTTTWEKVIRRLTARRDPPMGAPRPDDRTYRDVIAAVEAALDHAYARDGAVLPEDRAADTVVATRLATLIWSGPPDATLLDAARRGDLRSAEGGRRQVLRMLRDPRSMALVDAFFIPWLSLDKLKGQQPGASAPLRIDADLLQSMQTEGRLFLHGQLQEDHNAIDLWTANETYVDERLARHYGLTGVTGREFRRVTLADANRAGLLGQAGVLATLTVGGRTSPTVRGLYVLTRFLGMDAPPPPANVPPLREEPVGQLGTMRDRLLAHKTNPSCASCHAMFDPLGLGLENFDATGAWRTTDAGVPIDPSGTFVDGVPFTGPAGLRRQLVTYRDAYYAEVTRRLMAFALNRTGKGGRVYDREMGAVRTVMREASAQEYRWSAILAGIATSAPFQAREIVP